MSSRPKRRWKTRFRLWRRTSSAAEKFFLVILIVLLAGACIFVWQAASTNQVVEAASIAFVYLSLSFAVFIEIRNIRGGIQRDRKLRRISRKLSTLDSTVENIASNRPIPSLEVRNSLDGTPAEERTAIQNDQPQTPRVRTILQIGSFIIGKTDQRSSNPSDGQHDSNG